MSKSYIVASARPFRGVEPGKPVDVADLDDTGVSRLVRHGFIKPAPVKKSAAKKETD